MSFLDVYCPISLLQIKNILTCITDTHNAPIKVKHHTAIRRYPLQYLHVDADVKELHKVLTIITASSIPGTTQWTASVIENVNTPLYF